MKVWTSSRRLGGGAGRSQWGWRRSGPREDGGGERGERGIQGAVMAGVDAVELTGPSVISRVKTCSRPVELFGLAMAERR